MLCHFDTPGLLPGKNPGKEGQEQTHSVRRGLRNSYDSHPTCDGRIIVNFVEQPCLCFESKLTQRVRRATEQEAPRRTTPRKRSDKCTRIGCAKRIVGAESNAVCEGCILCPNVWSVYLESIHKQTNPMQTNDTIAFSSSLSFFWCANRSIPSRNDRDKPIYKTRSPHLSPPWKLPPSIYPKIYFFELIEAS